MALPVKGLEEALIRFLKKEFNETDGTDDPIIEIEDIETNAYEQSGCPTCYGGLDFEVDIYYRRDSGYRTYYTYNGRFGDLLQYLTDED